MSRAVWFGAGILLFLKVGLAALIPMFGDEAYYLYWGSQFSGGYYDLPPMVGWWLGALRPWVESRLGLRALALLVPVVVAFGLYEWLKPSLQKDRAAAGALLFFALPLPFAALLTFPDVPLLFFCFLSALLFYRAVRNHVSFFSFEVIAAGALMGAAFLSKYFAVLLIPAFLLHAWPRSRFRLGGMVSFSIGFLPFLLQHLIWNRSHCQANWVFNFITRQKVDEGSFIRTAGFFVLYLGVMTLPALVAVLVRGTGIEKREPSPDSDLERFFLMLWVVPALTFGSTALLGRGQGLHWLLFLTPFFAGWFSLKAASSTLILAKRIALAMSSVIGILLLISFSWPDRFLSPLLSSRYGVEYEWILHPEEFARELQPLLRGADAVFFDGYSRASTFHSWTVLSSRAAEFPVVGIWEGGSRFGRTFDFTQSWAGLAGKTIAWVSLKGRDPSIQERYQPFFETLRSSELSFRGYSVSVFYGTGFRAKNYWIDQVRPAVDLFYPPEWVSRCELREFDHAR